MLTDELTQQRDRFQLLIEDYETSIADLQTKIAEKEALALMKDAIAEETSARLQIQIAAAEERWTLVA